MSAALRRETIVEDAHMTMAAGTDERRLNAGDAPGQRRDHLFSPDKQARFFDHLADHANISAAARHAGVSVATVWRWRRKSAFSQRWMAALARGYDQLEMQLLAIARFGEHSESTTTIDADGNRHRQLRRDVPAFGFKLLAHHRDKVAAYEAAIAAAGRERASVPGIAAMLDLVRTIRTRIANGVAEAESDGNGL